MAINTNLINGSNLNFVGTIAAIGTPAVFNRADGKEVTSPSNTASQRQISSLAQNLIASYTSTERDTLNWSSGAAIWNSTLNCTQYYNGSAWINSKITAISTTAQTLALTDNVVIVTSSAVASSFSLTLADPSVVSGVNTTIALNHSLSQPNYGCTLNAPSGKTINGASSYVLSGQSDFVTLISNGNDWVVLEKPTGFLVLNNTTLTAQTTSITVSNIFSPKYTDYLFEGFIQMASGSGAFQNTFQFTSGGTANTTSNYNASGSYVGPFAGNINNTAQTSFTGFMNFTGATDYASFKILIKNPSTNAIKEFNSWGLQNYTFGGALYGGEWNARFTTAATLFDGIKYNIASGNATGWLKMSAILT